MDLPDDDGGQDNALGGGCAPQGISAETCIKAFMYHWIARFDVPETVTSDRGSQFSSFAWSSFCDWLGVRHAMTTAYHPQANGMVERVHRQLKDSLRARGASTDWPLHLPWVLLGLRAAPKEISGFSSAEAVLGQPLVLPGELAPGSEASPGAFHTNLSSSSPPATCQPRTYAEVAAQPADGNLQSARWVYVTFLIFFLILDGLHIYCTTTTYVVLSMVMKA